MKIALIVPGGVDASGEYRVIPALLALIRRLSLHHQVHVFALIQEPQPRSWDLLGARIHNIGVRHTRIRAVRAIRAEHRAGPFDVVHAIFSGSPGLIAVSAAWMLGIPSLVHLGGGELVALADIGYGGRLTWRGRVREALVLRAAFAVSAPSAPMIDRLGSLGIAARRIPLGVDTEIWTPSEPRRRDISQPAKLIHTASLNRVKDQPTLLLALARLRDRSIDFEMDVVGTDTLNGEMQRLSHSLSLSNNVRFRGFLPQQPLRALMQSAHLMMMSSQHEAGPVAMIEAAMTGVPTVGSAVGHIAEWAPTAAVAVRPGDAESLAREAALLLSDEEQRLRIAHEAWSRAVRQDADYTARTFEALYEEAIGVRRRSTHRLAKQ
ncbi:glycosyltransferase family 4 protein [Steroidobacter cummioxidans]|uniref:glycosyltransferase family 4 protein n=1 Tax=Steroidobacter cummioxidans TaxID=1803913 RepID=UPI000E30F3DF|nr:glycosyltransferase family 4 protein [Steroidobacter cummioxidans]